MDGPPGSDSVLVVICFGNESVSMRCEPQMTMAQVRDAWFAEIKASPSVAFFTPNQRCLPDHLTVPQALLQSGNHRFLELHVFFKFTFWLQLFGYEHSPAPFQVASILTPGAVRREIEEAVGIVTDDFRLSNNGAALDPDQPFNAQGLVDGATLTVDLRLTVNIDVEQPEGEERRRLFCFCSQTVGELHQELGLEDNTVLVATAPYRRVLSDSLHLCHIVGNIMDLHVPMNLIAERKVLMSFEPISLPHRRQQVPVALSCTPLDLLEMLSEVFDMTTEFQLSVDGQALEKFQTLIEQNIDSDAVIQLDIVRHCIVKDQWADLQELKCDDEMFLYSSESPRGLYLRDFSYDHQSLTFEGLDLTIFGSMLDVFGAVTGQRRSSLLIDRDVERSLPVMSFEYITQKQAWARSMLLDVVPVSRGLSPKEIMCHGRFVAAKNSLKRLCLTGDSLLVPDPMKVTVSSNKRLHVFRFARGSTHGDLLARMRQLRGSPNIGLKAHGRPVADEQINSKMDLQLYLLSSEDRFRTKLTVSLDGSGYGCWFLPDRVRFEDIMINVGKQAEVSPRLLFRKKLYCKGCGRKIWKEEETFQHVPSDCCRVRSLQLTDRKVKGVGTQTAVPRGCNKETYTLYPEERDASVMTDQETTYHTTGVSSPLQSVATAHPPRPLSSPQINVTTPKGEVEEKTVTVEGYRCRALLAAAAEQLETLLEDASVVCEEFSYEREQKMRNALKCFDQAERWIGYFDCEDGRDIGYFSPSSLRFLQPSSPLPSVPNRQLIISIRTNTDLLTGNSQRDLRAAPPNALTDPAFVALLRGVRSGTQFFWDNGEGRFVNAESGRVCVQEEIGGETPKRHFILLLREGLVPRIAIPENTPLLLLKREDLDLQIERGRLCCAASAQVDDMERWSFVYHIEDFYRELMAASRN